MLSFAPILMVLLGASGAQTPTTTSPEAQIRQIQARALRQIQALNGEPSSEAQRTIEHIKVAAERQILRLRLSLVEQQGDSLAAAAFRQALEGLEHPERHRAAPTAPPRLPPLAPSRR